MLTNGTNANTPKQKTIEQIFNDHEVIQRFLYMLKYRTYHPEECAKKVRELANFITKKYGMEFESYT